MTLSLHDASLPVFVHALRRLQHVLRIGEAFAREQGIDPSELLQRRLAADMFPLVRQVQIASDTAKGSAARLAGVEPPSFPDEETGFDALQARLERTVAFIEGLDPHALDDAASRTITLPTRTRGELRWSAQDYLLQFGLPNLYFHVTAAYAILRHAGAPLGKWDYLGAIG